MIKSFGFYLLGWFVLHMGAATLSAQTTFIWDGSVSSTWQTGTDQGNWSGDVYSPGNGGGNNFQFTAVGNPRSTINLTGGHNPNTNNLLLNGNTTPLIFVIDGSVNATKIDLTPLSSGATTITVASGTHTIRTSGSGGTTNAGTVELQSQANSTWDIQGTSMLTIESVIQGTSSNRGFTKIGTGTLVLSGNNVYGGKTSINNGILRIDAENRLGANPASLTADQFSLNGGTLQTTASFALDDSNRGITLGASGGTISPDDGTTLTVAKVITGAGALTKSGAGSLILSAANTYLGNTVLSTGSLIVTNTTGSATGTGNLQITGGVLRGTGTIAPATAGTVTVADDAIISVGLQTAVAGDVLTLGAASTATILTLETGSTIEFDLFTGAGLGDNTATLAADLFRTGGTVIIESGVTLRVSNPNGMTGFAVNDTWRLFDWTTLGGSAPTGTFDNALLDLPDPGGDLEWDLSQLYTNGSISIVLVPEPGRWLLCLVGLGLMTLQRRR